MTESSPQPFSQETTNEFPSYLVLKEAHCRLTEEERNIGLRTLEDQKTAESAAIEADRETEAYLDDVEDFMLRAADTGRILEDENERSSVLTLLS